MSASDDLAPELVSNKAIVSDVIAGACYHMVPTLFAEPVAVVPEWWRETTP